MPHRKNIPGLYRIALAALFSQENGRGYITPYYLGNRDIQKIKRGIESGYVSNNLQFLIPDFLQEQIISKDVHLNLETLEAFVKIRQLKRLLKHKRPADFKLATMSWELD